MWYTLLALTNIQSPLLHGQLEEREIYGTGEHGGTLESILVKFEARYHIDLGGDGELQIFVTRWKLRNEITRNSLVVQWLGLVLSLR